ncbi:LysE family transporter [Rodentibacter haemolyticus]|uniref:LysE family transporter n=1 Tax=Rodentibacter haemolyticus TaxID=2778911 RepID=A0ABX6UWZ2_9PAST|nr:LysE family transporter [Rodentibacter haemolyticus]QPB42620.1 LysE family transporter [Rodentibacter haemolyticus]
MLNLIIVHLFGLMTPGPDFFYVSRMAASNSRRNTICGILGITLGVAFWAALSMLGLAMLFVTMPALHGVIMLMGGSYLAYLGFLMARSKKHAQFELVSASELNQQTTIKKEIMKGLLVNLSNAKVVVYFSSVMSLVLVNITETWQIVFAFAVIVVETFFYFYAVSLIFSRNIAKRLYSQYSRYIDNAAGIVFLFFGLLLIYNGINEIIHS